jgi:hypothetical protein
MGWSQIGWRVDVRFQALSQQIRPKDHIGRLRSHLPAKYSPLTPDGRGLQSVYLAEIGEHFAHALLQLIGPEAFAVRELAATYVAKAESVLRAEPTIEEWERRVEQSISQDATIGSTEKEALVLARRGQGRFRSNVQLVENRCRVTGVDRPEHLIASHTKPWRKCSNEERLNGENGLLLTPTIDHLFDKGFISFERAGRLLISPVVDRISLYKMGIRDDSLNVGAFSRAQSEFLAYHHEHVFRQSQRR